MAARACEDFADKTIRVVIVRFFNNFQRHIFCALSFKIIVYRRKAEPLVSRGRRQTDINRNFAPLHRLRLNRAADHVALVVLL